MDIQTDLNWIHQELDKVKDTSFIEKLKHLLQNFGKVETDADYNIDIETALKSIAEGKLYSDYEARTISKKWGR